MLLLSKRSIRRRSLAIREDYAEKLAYYAKSRGMSISSYLSDLIEAAGEVEEMGVYAPKALREAKLIYQLLSYQMVLVPLEYLVSSCRSAEGTSLNVVRRIAKTLSMLKVDSNTLMSILLRNLPYVIDDGRKFIITKHERTATIVGIIKEFAKSLGLKVEDSEEILIIHKLKS